MAWARPTDPQTLVIPLTFSGGGTPRGGILLRGCSEELCRRRRFVHTPRGAHPALAEVDAAVAGTWGSFTALAYALYGERLF